VSYRRAEEVVADEDSFVSKVSFKHRRVHKSNKKELMLILLRNKIADNFCLYTLMFKWLAVVLLILFHCYLSQLFIVVIIIAVIIVIIIMINIFQLLDL